MFIIKEPKNKTKIARDFCMAYCPLRSASSLLKYKICLILLLNKQNSFLKTFSLTQSSVCTTPCFILVFNNKAVKVYNLSN